MENVWFMIDHERIKFDLKVKPPAEAYQKPEVHDDFDWTFEDNQTDYSERCLFCSTGDLTRSERSIEAHTHKNLHFHKYTQSMQL